MKDDFAILELEEGSIEESVRDKKNKKPAALPPWGGYTGPLEDLLDPKYGPIATMVASYKNKQYLVAVSPTTFEKYGHVTLHLDPGRDGKLYVRGWFDDPNGSARPQQKKRKVHRFLHSMICGVPQDSPVWLQVNHINNLPLDNRDLNLEVVIPSVNAHHRAITGTGASQYHGVHWQKGRWSKKKKHFGVRNKPYHAVFGFMGKRYYVGTFETELEAARAVDAKLLTLLAKASRFLSKALPIDQINRLLNFKRAEKEIDAFFAQYRRKLERERIRRQRRKEQREKEMDIPF